MNVKPLHNTRSFHSTRGGLTHTKHMRENLCNSDHALLPESSQVMIGQICAQRFLHWKRCEGYNLDCSKSQANILNHAHRRVTCILSCESLKTCAGTVTSGGQKARDAASNWERDWQERFKSWQYQLALSSKNLCHDDRVYPIKPTFMCYQSIEQT